jgi:hypothetical protein
VNATLISNATAIECISPAASQTGLIEVNVYFEGKLFTPDSLYFTYYSLVYLGSNYSHILDCSDYEDDCYGCTAIPNECYWCIPGGCSSVCSGLGLTNECPSNVLNLHSDLLVITSLSPNNTDVSGGVVTVQGIFSATDAIGYQCIFESQAADATWVSSTQLQCDFQSYHASTGNVSITYNGYPFSLNSLIFEYHGTVQIHT